MHPRGCVGKYNSAVTFWTLLLLFFKLEHDRVIAEYTPMIFVKIKPKPNITGGFTNRLKHDLFIKFDDYETVKTSMKI